VGRLWYLPGILLIASVLFLANKFWMKPQARDVLDILPWTVVRRTALTNGASLIENIESSKVMVIYWWGCCRDQLTAITDLAPMDFFTSTIHTWISQLPQIFGVGMVFFSYRHGHDFE